ncbi:MAG: hypothetical protein COT15_01400 [Candidatus Diapherotrites archaeon CG08_land_8_20_14_0_20_34_12]|nr:MAG: hypothetical protein COT15_01400 [Candidatus Diapherotrites archaeon CG08_land_8_20_14_0_20_34_12]
MNCKGLYSGVFGLMAILVASLLLTTTYSSIKTNPNQSISDEMLKVKKAWQNIYLSADSISTSEFGKIATDVCPIGNGALLQTTLTPLFTQLVTEINKGNVLCSNPIISNISIAQQGSNCNLSFNLKIYCKKENKKDNKVTTMVDYDKTAAIMSTKILQP